MKILKNLKELVNAEVIDQQTADRIKAYYTGKTINNPNRLFIVFGILGAILVGLGIILIIAHNWDNLSKSFKTSLAFAPMIIGQIVCGYLLISKRKSKVWREGASAFLIFAIGACISLISQIYNIPGNLSSFMLVWTLLSIPLIYLMNSSVASMLCILGATLYATESGYNRHSEYNPLLYIPLVAFILPHYIKLLRKSAKSNFTIFHNWLLPASMTLCLGAFAQDHEEIQFVSYCSLFGLFYILGDLKYFNAKSSLTISYKVIGSLGTVILLLITSFDWLWYDLYEKGILLDELLSSVEFWSAVILSVSGIIALIVVNKTNDSERYNPFSFVFILFIIAFVIAYHAPMVSTVLINIFLLLIGLLIMKMGAEQDHLGILNYGLLIITALVICRFFDTHISFVIRGVLFVIVGAGFFSANYWLLKKRNA